MPFYLKSWLSSLEKRLLVLLLSRLEDRHVFGPGRADHQVVDAAGFLREKLKP